MSKPLAAVLGSWFLVLSWPPGRQLGVALRCRGLECNGMIFGGEDKINPAGGKGLDASGKMLIAANLIPLVGVLAWDWSVFHVVVVYWLENVIIGVINILQDDHLLILILSRLISRASSSSG